MPVSPRKNVSQINNSTVNKGVQAREIDIANIRLDTEALSLSRAATESSEWPADMWIGRAGIAGMGAMPGGSHGALAAGDAPTAPTPHSPPSTDHSVSYVQVVVQKQRRPPARHPTASSPMHVELKHPTIPMAAPDHSAVPATVLLACPAFAALHQQSRDRTRGFNESGSCGIQAATIDARTSAGHDKIKKSEINTEKVKQQYFWKKMHCSYKHDADDYDDGPDCVEVYEFDNGVEALVARGAKSVSCIERSARRASRPAAALLAEVLAVPRLAVTIPSQVVIQLQRCVLLVIREVTIGVVQTTSDVLVKPLLALAFNAVWRPPLVCIAHSAQSLREAIRPLTLVLADTLEPFAKLLAAVRLVHVERHCTCTCTHHV